MSELAPATLEGWYALHQMVRVDWGAIRAADDGTRRAWADDARALLAALDGAHEGWSAVFQLVGGGADWMWVHFRPTLDELGAVQQRLRRSSVGALCATTYDYTSVTEAGLYDATAEAAREAAPGSPEYRRHLEQLTAAERAIPHIELRLYPRVPEAMRYVSFYPMSKRRTHPDNWYSLPIEERNRLMREHGLTGRTYAGRVFQIITGSVGFDEWEWGVTLFSADPLEFKRIVTEMRYDEASAKYGEFGEFFTGYRLQPEDLVRQLAAE